MDSTAVITRYILQEFLPGTDRLPGDYDLLATGVIDSLALLKVVDWIGERFRLSLDDVDISPESFRTVNAISAFVESVRKGVVHT